MQKGDAATVSPFIFIFVRKYYFRLRSFLREGRKPPSASGRLAGYGTAVCAGAMDSRAEVVI